MSPETDLITLISTYTSPITAFDMPEYGKSPVREKPHCGIFYAVDNLYLTEINVVSWIRFLTLATNILQLLQSMKGNSQILGRYINGN